MQCKSALALSRLLVEEWLQQYMFGGKDYQGWDEERKSETAKDIAQWLADHDHFKSHSRHIPRKVLKERGLNVKHLEDDDDFQDLVLSVFHAATHAFAQTSAVKIVENHLGRSFIKTHAVEQQALPQLPAEPSETSDDQ